MKRLLAAAVMIGQWRASAGLEVTASVGGTKRLHSSTTGLRGRGPLYECIEGYLDGVTAEEFAKPVDMRAHGLGMWKGLDIYNLHGISHPRIHGGETACLKGLQGAPGWEMRWRSGIERPA